MHSSSIDNTPPADGASGSTARKPLQRPWSVLGAAVCCWAIALAPLWFIDLFHMVHSDAWSCAYILARWLVVLAILWKWPQVSPIGGGIAFLYLFFTGHWLSCSYVVAAVLLSLYPRRLITQYIGGTMLVLAGPCELLVGLVMSFFSRPDDPPEFLEEWLIGPLFWPIFLAWGILTWFYIFGAAARRYYAMPSLEKGTPTPEA